MLVSPANGWKARHTALIVGLFTLVLTPGPARAQSPSQPLVMQPQSDLKIGVAAAVSGKVEVASTSQVGRIVQSGRPIFIGDVITTDSTGRLQILLLDETVFTIGPNSAIVIDTFVYDPSTHEGRLTAQILKGAFRFVTGKIAKKNPESMEVKLPVGTIGVRGTMVAGIVEGQRSTTVLLGPGPNNQVGAAAGAIVISNPVGVTTRTVLVNRPGFHSVIAGADVPPTPPTPVPPDVLDAINHELAGPAPSEHAPRLERGEQGPGDRRGRGRRGDHPGPHGPEGPDDGPPSAAELHEMYEAGEITEAQLNEMLTDMEAWESGDPEVRAQLMAKYSGHDGEDGGYYDPETGMYHDPDGGYYDPETNTYYDADGNTHDPGTMMHDMDGGYYDPETGTYQDPDGGYYDPATGTYHDPDGGYFDPSTGMYYDPDGGHFDSSAGIYYEPDGGYFDPSTGMYYDSHTNEYYAYDPYYDPYYDDHDDATYSQDAADAASRVGDGIATWDQLRTFPTGTGYYQGTGALGSFVQTIMGGTTNLDIQGRMSVRLEVNFGNRTVGGGGSASFLKVNTVGPEGAWGGNIQQTMNIDLVDFTALGGDASWTQGTSNLTGTFTIENVGGRVADVLDVDATYDDGGVNVGSGSLDNVAHVVTSTN